MGTERRTGRRFEATDAPSRMIKDCKESAEGVICLLLVVVRMRDCRESDDGRYEATFSVRSEMLEVDGSENERVDGSDRPGKDESKMFTLDDAIFE